MRSLVAALVTLCLLVASGARPRLEPRNLDRDAHVTDGVAPQAVAARRVNPTTPDLRLPPFVATALAVAPTPLRTATSVATYRFTTPLLARVVPRTSRGPPLG